MKPDLIALWTHGLVGGPDGSGTAYDVTIEDPELDANEE